MLGNGSRPESFLDAVLFVRPMTNPDARDYWLSAMPYSLTQA